MSSSPDYESARFYLRGPTKKTLQHRSIETGRDMSAIVQEAIDMALSDEWVRIPVLGQVGAGPSVICEEHVEQYVTLPASATAGADFALRARGDSMEPRIADGDLVLVRLQPSAEIGQIVVARQDGEAVIKRLAATNGEMELRSDNPEYAPLVLPRGVIVGRAVKVIKDL